MIERFKAEHLKSGRCQESTWRATYGAEFNRLLQDSPLSEASVLTVVLSKQDDIRIRQLTCAYLDKLAAFAGLDVDLSIYEGSYSRNSLQARNLPSDELIESVRLTIPNPGWQWVYGICAAFGLRPHEAFFCEFEDAESLQVVISNTRPHTAKALLQDSLCGVSTKTDDHSCQWVDESQSGFIPLGL